MASTIAPPDRPGITRKHIILILTIPTPCSNKHLLPLFQIECFINSHPFGRGSTLKRKKLLLEKQILSFKSWPLLTRDAQIVELLILKVFLFLLKLFIRFPCNRFLTLNALNNAPFMKCKAHGAFNRINTVPYVWSDSVLMPSGTPEGPLIGRLQP